ncbi:MAG: helix-hairpin-helix domain-containing protein, partial [Nitrospirota bacterium]
IARESRLLEQEQSLSSQSQPTVTDIPGLSERLAEKLKEAGLADLEKLSNISMEELTAVEGIGEKTAKKIVDGAKELLGQ